MKKVFTIMTITAAIAVVMVSCQSRSVNMPATTQDTTGFAAFKEWQAMKAQEEMIAAAVAAERQKQLVVVVREKTSMSSSTTNEAKTAEKKGWSKAAKGTVIGATGGAVLGAVINKKNRVAGGIIGGVLGGGIGYGIGRSKDKKDGRY